MFQDSARVFCLCRVVSVRRCGFTLPTTYQYILKANLTRSNTPRPPTASLLCLPPLSSAWAKRPLSALTPAHLHVPVETLPHRQGADGIPPPSLNLLCPVVGPTQRLRCQRVCAVVPLPYRAAYSRGNSGEHGGEGNPEPDGEQRRREQVQGGAGLHRSFRRIHVPDTPQGAIILDVCGISRLTSADVSL